MLRLFMFECGTLECQKHQVVAGQPLGVPYEIPVPWFALDHPRGVAIIDGGNAPAAAINAERHWGGAARSMHPTMRPEQACVPSLRRVGIELSDVTILLQSHLHFDHTGALAQISDLPAVRQVIATRAEYEYAQAPDAFSAGAYIRADFDKPGVPWFLLDREEDGWDVFGDGVLRCWSTPGHSPGHQSFEITLPETGSVLVTGDAAYTHWQWEELALPGFLTCASDAIRSVRKLRRLADRSGSLVVLGHDPDAWPMLRHPPEFYA